MFQKTPRLPYLITVIKTQLLWENRNSKILLDINFRNLFEK